MNFICMEFSNALWKGNLPVTELGLRADAQDAQSPGACVWVVINGLLCSRCLNLGVLSKAGGLLPTCLYEKSGPSVTLLTPLKGAAAFAGGGLVSSR